MNTTTEGQFLWLLIITISQVAQLASTLYGFRRKPPLAEELFKKYVTKDDLEKTCARHLREQEQFAEFKAHQDKVDAEIFGRLTAIQKYMADIERAIGKIEGHIEAMSHR